MGKFIQVGLTCKTEDQLEKFADRVSNYNKDKGFIVVEMEGRPKKEQDPKNPEAHFDVRLEFKSPQYFKDFWYDPAYTEGYVVATES